mgnify:CR=1 FL=1
MAAAQMRNLALEVVTELFAQIATSYPVLREAFQGSASTILEEAEEECTKALEQLLAREKDPFTINDFLQAHINKLRYDRFDMAIERAFGSLQSATADSWSAAKEEVASSLRTWYRQTHGVDSGANAEEMAAIMEAYYTLASKRFVDNVCCRGERNKEPRIFFPLLDDFSVRSWPRQRGDYDRVLDFTPNYLAWAFQTLPIVHSVYGGGGRPLHLVLVLRDPVDRAFSECVSISRSLASHAPPQLTQRSLAT